MESHLLQMRGLKLTAICFYRRLQGSHLLQMRGLKQHPCHKLQQNPTGRIFYRCVD